MFRSFLLITLRILWRNKVTSFVNIFSLSVGITAFMFIMLYVWHEINYDTFNANYDRIYRLEADDYGMLPPSIGNHVKDNIPEVENVATFSTIGKGDFSYSPGQNPENEKQVPLQFAYGDSTIFNVFTFPLIHGDPTTVLKRPMTAVLTESAVKKLFGDLNPIGSTIEYDHHSYAITGIISDVTSSHIEIEAILSMSSIAKLYPGRNLNLTGPSSGMWSATYLLTTKGVEAKTFEDKINRSLEVINKGRLIDTEFHRFHLRPLRDVYFDHEVQNLSYGLHGNVRTIQILSAIGTFMLVLAGINYVNLTTARSSVRGKEIAIKRVTGSSAGLLRVQLLGESVMLSLVSVALALTIIQLFLPWFNQLTGVQIELSKLNRPLVWIEVTAGAIALGILAGLYPAFYLTSIKPVQLIKGKGVRDAEGSLFRSGLMTFQFALSIIMIAAIIVNYQQLDYLKTSDLGFNKEKVINVNTPSDIKDEFVLRNTFRTKLLRHPEVENVSFSYGIPGSGVSDSPTLDINGTQGAVKVIYVDEEYIKVMGIKLAEGKDFSPGSPEFITNDSTGFIIVNESIAKDFNLQHSLGTKVYDVSHHWSAEIVGVVKDFHIRSLRENIEPTMLMWLGSAGNSTNIRIASDDLPATLKAIEEEWRSVWNHEPFNFEFLDESFNRQYKRDEQLGTAIGYFTLVAVVIACLGLFALSSFTVSRRTKEIGVRKALGASVGTIYSMLSWAFLKWILVALVFAVPTSWYLMNLWLATFAFHIILGLDVFIIAGLLAIAIALLTITVQSLKAANANPIDSLRYE